MSAKVETMQEITSPPDFVLHGASYFKLTPEEWDFLRTTVSKDDEEIKKRAFEVQAETHAVCPYPCIQLFEFLKPTITSQSVYPTVIEEAKNNPDALYLDLACCMGTDARKVVLDGIPASRVIGSDIQEEFLQGGYKLYDDRTTTRISFFTADIFSISPTFGHDKLPSQAPLSEVKSLNELKGRMTYIYVSALFHLFDEKTQRAVAERIANLLRVPTGGSIGDAPVAGCILFGRHQGLESPAVLPNDWKSERYAHSPESWANMWRSVFEERNGQSFAADHLQFKNELRIMRLPDNKGLKLMYWNIRII